jgi:hypothetical protein
MGIFGEKCLRCGEARTKKSFDGVPTCDTCRLKIDAKREVTRLCPIDSNVMRKDVIHNVIIDRCDKCGGVWLDGGELDVMKEAIEAGAGANFTTGMILGMAMG